LSGEERSLGRRRENVKKIPSAILELWKKIMHFSKGGIKAHFNFLKTT